MGTMHCEECAGQVEVDEEYEDSHIDPITGMEREYRIYLMTCGHETSYPTSRTWQH